MYIFLKPKHLAVHLIGLGETMSTKKEHIRNLYKIRQESLLRIEEHIAREGMNPSLRLLNEKDFLEDELANLEGQLAELGECGEKLISKEDTERHKQNLQEELNLRLTRLKEFRDTAILIRKYVRDESDHDPKTLIPQDFSEKFSRLYAEVAPYMREILEELGFERKQISESIMAFVTSSPQNMYQFMVDTNRGLSFIQMALHRHALMARDK